jgi:hypothetical protein
MEVGFPAGCLTGDFSGGLLAIVQHAADNDLAADDAIENHMLLSNETPTTKKKVVP